MTIKDALMKLRSSVIKALEMPDVPNTNVGKWIDTDNYYQRFKCSICGCHTRDAKPPYCPNCGKKME